MTAATDLARRARFISVEDGFNIKRPALEPYGFDAELGRARDPAAPTGRIDLDCSHRLGTPWPATSPLMLARYARIRRGERLAGAAAEIAARLEALYARTLAPDTPGRALFLTSTRMAAGRTCTPSLTLTLNAVLPGEAQPPHRHNAAAIVFIMKQGSCRSRIGDAEFPWDHAAALLTPPNAVHSHRNDGKEAAVALIVQDGGLHYHCRTMGFAFA